MPERLFEFISLSTASRHHQRHDDELCRHLPDWRHASAENRAYAPKNERTAPPAAMIAIAQMQIAAPGLGLGSTFTGSINTASQSYPPLIELLGIPEASMAYGTFVLGYPAEQYHSIPVRKPVDVTWR